MVAAKRTAKKAPAKRAAVKPVKTVEEIIQRVIDCTIDYAQENDSCQSGVIEFLSDALDMPLYEVTEIYKAKTSEQLSFTLNINVTGVTPKVLEGLSFTYLDPYALAEHVLGELDIPENEVVVSKAEIEE